MPELVDNPFSATRAADFTDQQIYQYWVDLGEDGGFFDLIKPRSDMPMLILGGKGSGKTHVMRYLSFPLQRLRHEHDLLSGIESEGYLGIYMRCSGLNSARFRNKGQTEDRWATVFAYYMEIWLAQMVTEICVELLDQTDSVAPNELELVRDLIELFDDPLPMPATTLSEMLAHFKNIQRDLDIAVNNCAITGLLNVTIRATLGRLVYGIPAVFAKHVPALAKCMFVYLFDEFENLTEVQQQFVNTLIREKRPPCSFKIGSRLYGVVTSATYCAGEENKEGSEFESLPLDSRLRRDEARYGQFAQRLVVKRLASTDSQMTDSASIEKAAASLSLAFESIGMDGLAESETEFVVQKYFGRERPYFRVLRQVLEQGLAAGAAPGVQSVDVISKLLDNLRCDCFPLLEKLNCFILYQRWSAKDDNLLRASGTIHNDCAKYLAERSTTTKYHDKLLHFKYDLIAQLRRECDQKQLYAGWDTLVDLSWGNPRHLLILLKHIISWATFKGEQPFSQKPISIAAQVAGVREAADWFFKDARMTGQDGKLVQDGIGRLGTLFRTIRYSHKPSECSLCTFSYDPTKVTETTRRLVDFAEKWSLLVYVEGGQRDRNSERVDVKLQLNRMLAPLWDISFNRRGALALSASEVDAVFDPTYAGMFDDLLSAREARMTAPFFGRPSKRTSSSDDQSLLPGMDSE